MRRGAAATFLQCSVRVCAFSGLVWMWEYICMCECVCCVLGYAAAAKQPGAVHASAWLVFAAINVT